MPKPEDVWCRLRLLILILCHELYTLIFKPVSEALLINGDAAFATDWSGVLAFLLPWPFEIFLNNKNPPGWVKKPIKKNTPTIARERFIALAGVYAEFWRDHALYTVTNACSEARVQLQGVRTDRHSKSKYT